MSKQTATIIRTITTAPVTAFILLIILRAVNAEFFASDAHFILHVAFLCVLPALSYLFTRTIPALRARGRELERNLAIIFSVAGYAGSFITAVLFGGAPIEKVFAATYLFSAAATALCTLFKFKSSGHACSVSGPVAMLGYAISPWFAFGFLLLLPIFSSSLKLKRHTIFQLAIGTLIPILAMILAIIIFA